jgi:ketosteroid isomerase-like protein
MDLETLIAKQEITDVVYAYARGIDRLDFELVRSCYHPDAYDDHGAFKGNVDDFIEMCEGFLPRWTATMHFMGNVLVDEITEDSARAETYAVAYHRRETTAGIEGKDDIFGIRYVDRFEKRDDRWLIAHRVVATEWRRVEPVPANGTRGAVGVWGTRDGNDVIDWIMDAQGAPS